MSTPTAYNRFDQSQDFDSIDFLPDRWLQSPELNELQSMFAHRLRGLGDALYSDGAIVRDARCTVDAGTGIATLESGAIYIKGAVRGVLPATLEIPTTGTVYIGVYVQTESVTENDDPGLRNPAAGTLGYQQPGAWRTRLRLVWGVKDDGKAGDFFGIWEVESGIVRQREAAAQLNPITQALASYDRDSAGGTYIVDGMHVSMLADHADGAQMYSISAGHARVGGYPAELLAARTVKLSTAPDLVEVDSEPHLSDGETAQAISFGRWPVVGVPEVRIQARRSVDIVHGGFTGVADPLPDTAVIQIDQVKLGSTIYTSPADYVYTAGQIDWSPGGAEPAPGSTYQVTYQYIKLAEPQNLTPTGFEVSGAIAGTLIQVTYQFAQRRIDRLVLNGAGDVEAIRGVPDTWAPQPPPVPENMLALASITQTWDSRRSLQSDGVRLVPMPVLEDYDRRLDDMRAQMAELRLAVAIAGRYSGLARGQFADPMLDGGMRDAGQPQTAAIAQGWLQLATGADAHQINVAAGQITIAYTQAAMLSQPLITGALALVPPPPPAPPPGVPPPPPPPRPAVATLTPDVDRWVENIRLKTSINIIAGRPGENQRDEVTRVLRSMYQSGGGTMRTIEVVAEVRGFKPGEQISGITFGGHRVTAAATAAGSMTATAQGVASAKFNIPAGLPSGTVQVVITGGSGTRASANYTGEVRRLFGGYVRTYIMQHGSISLTMFKDIEI